MVGQLMRQIRQGAGHSLREAEARTGIHRCLLNKLENGKKVRRRPVLLRQFAERYGVDPGLLLRGDNPLGAFCTAVTVAPTSLRTSFMAASFENRVSMALDFFVAQPGDTLSVEGLATAAGLSKAELQELRATWRRGAGNPMHGQWVAAALTNQVGLSPAWFIWGVLGEEPGFDGWLGYMEQALMTAYRARPTWGGSERMEPINCLRRLVEAG